MLASLVRDKGTRTLRVLVQPAAPGRRVLSLGVRPQTLQFAVVEALHLAEARLVTLVERVHGCLIVEYLLLHREVGFLLTNALVVVIEFLLCLLSILARLFQNRAQCSPPFGRYRQKKVNNEK